MLTALSTPIALLFLVTSASQVWAENHHLTENSPAVATSDSKRLAPKAQKNAQAAPDVSAVSVGGRLVTRATLIKRDVSDNWLTELAIPTAELKISYRRKKRVKVQVEADFGNNRVRIKDSYLRVRLNRQLHFQAGHFKRPMSPIALAAGKSLPFVQRGLLSDDIINASYEVPLNLGGRSEGAQLVYQPRFLKAVTMIAGLFNSILPNPANVSSSDLYSDLDNLISDTFVRVVVALPFTNDIELGLGGARTLRARAAGELDHALIGALDLTVKHELGRMWLEAFAGDSPYLDGSQSGGTFWAARLAIAPKLQLKQLAPVAGLVEPYLIASLLSPSSELKRALAREYGGGMSLYPSSKWRFQVQFSRLAGQANYPTSDSSTIHIQLDSWF